jgi:hypothetical protein
MKDKKKFFLLEQRINPILQSYLNLHSGQTYQLFPLLCPVAGLVMGKIAWSGPPMFPFPCVGTRDRGQPEHRAFSYHAFFTITVQPLAGWRWGV